MSPNQLYSLLLTAVVGLVSSLLMGKTFRSIIFWPFSWLVRKSKNTTDEKILAALERDAGIVDPIEQFEGKPLIEEKKEK